MTSPDESMIRLVSWNTNGIRDTNQSEGKITTLLNSDIQADIVFLQETHIGPDCYQILENVPGWNVYFTVYSPRSKGVAILIKNSVPFEYICHDEDCNGCYIVLFCRLFGELHTLVNVYYHKADEYFLVRLKDYLMETAEGILVVGGDFNTVFHPSFDRKSSSSQARHSPFRDALKYFTVSLNLRDAWSHVRSTDEGFTRRQNNSFSRIDMFLLPEHRMERVCNITVVRHGIDLPGVSDHFPLVLVLKVRHCTEELLPKVASCWLKPYTPDRRPGKISGAEILSVIKSLTEIEELPLDRYRVQHCKTQCCELSESLKLKYNAIMENTVELEQPIRWQYFVLSQIMARRLSALISIKGNVEMNHDTFLNVTFRAGPQQIKWSFLLNTINKLHPELPNSRLPPEFRFLDYLLPCESAEFRLLEPKYPLTKAILSLALNELELIVSENSIKCTVCYQRQVLRIQTPQMTSDSVDVFVSHIMQISGLTLTTYLQRSPLSGHN